MSVAKKKQPVKAASKAKAKPAKPLPVAKQAKKATAPVSAKPRPMAPRGADPMAAPRFLALLDKAELHDLVYTFARALDRMDETLLRSVCHATATFDLGPGVFQGSISDYVPWVLGVLGQARMTQHMIGQVLVHLDGDEATVESYAHIHFRSDKPTGREDLFLGVRYLDKCERRPAGRAGVFKIAHRKQVIDWVRTEAVSDIFYHQNPDALWSSRTKTDPSYQMTAPGQSNGRAPSYLGRRYDVKSFKF